MYGSESWVQQKDESILSEEMRSLRNICGKTACQSNGYSARMGYGRGRICENQRGNAKMVQPSRAYG